MPKEAVIRWSPWKNASIAIFGFLIVVAVLLSSGWSRLEGAGKPFGAAIVISTVIFAVGSLLLLRNAFDRHPQLVIFKGGISIQNKQMRLIPWSKIVSCRTLSVGRWTKALVLVLTEDLEDYNQQRSPWSRLMIRVDTMLVGGPTLVIKTSAYDMGHAQICALVERWIAYYRR